MTPQDNLNNNLIQAAQHGNLINVKSLIMSVEKGHLEVVKYLFEKGANIHTKNDCALKWSASNGHFEVVKYLVIDCNMVIKKETLEYLEENN
jgi:ankyrin repeat protein